MTTKGVALMLQKMRQESNGLGLLGVELVLHCAERPRTVAELCHLTGAGNGQVNRVLNGMAVRYDATADKVRLPALHLLNRTTRPEGKGFVYGVTRKGEELCKAAGLNCMGTSTTEVTRIK